MKREPEPELMSGKEQVIAYDNGDFSVSEDVFVSFIDDFLNTHNISLNKGDLVVDLGCGPGNITKKIAVKWPHVRLLGIDGSNEMILRAKHNLKSIGKENYLANVEYICEEIKNIQLSDIAPLGNIKLLVSNSLIHHLTNINDFFDCIEKLSTSKTINFHKKPDIFVKTVELIAKDFPVKVILTGPARGYIKNELYKRNIRFKHIFLDKYEDIVDYYHALDLYIPSKDCKNL